MSVPAADGDRDRDRDDRGPAGDRDAHDRDASDRRRIDGGDRDGSTGDDAPAAGGGDGDGREDGGEGDGRGGTDPRVVHTVVVTREDVLAAIAARRRGDPAVLRITPPFSGRMRARIHLAVADDAADPGPDPVHLDPGDLVDRPPPTPDDTEDAIRADPEDRYSPERHRERHEERVDRWRETVAVADRIALGLDGDAHEVTVSVLGD